jgi:hypothetical protein
MVALTDRAKVALKSALPVRRLQLPDEPHAWAEAFRRAAYDNVFNEARSS